jgi:signal peptidase I
VLTAAVISVLALRAVRSWLAKPFTVSSDGMAPIIPPGSVVFLYKPAAAAGRLRDGVVVAFASLVDGQTAIKRVIAREEQSVAIRDSELFVDDIAIVEPFINHGRMGPAPVPYGVLLLSGGPRVSNP